MVTKYNKGIIAGIGAVLSILNALLPETHGTINTVIAVTVPALTGALVTLVGNSNETPAQIVPANNEGKS